MNDLRLSTSRNAKLLHHLIAKGNCRRILERVTDDVVADKTERTLGNQLRIELTNRSSSKIARIFEQRQIGLFALSIECRKLLLEHHDFPANFRASTQKMRELLIFP